MFMGSESGAQLGLQLLLPSSDLFSSHSAAMEDWAARCTFYLYRNDQGSRIQAERRYGGTQGGHVRG